MFGVALAPSDSDPLMRRPLGMGFALELAGPQQLVFEPALAADPNWFVPGAPSEMTDSGRLRRWQLGLEPVQADLGGPCSVLPGSAPLSRAARAIDSARAGGPAPN